MLPKRIHIALRQRRCMQQCLSTVASSKRGPWFVYPDESDFLPQVHRNVQEEAPSVFQTLPEDTPSLLKEIHSELSTSPYLETSCLVITRPVEPIPGPSLPLVPPQGTRRLRGGTTAGTGIDVPGNGLWSWFLFAQVKEGSESRGSINRMVKIVRKMLGQLAARDPAVHLPPKPRQTFTDGWAMLDVGDFAIHILSRDAREKWFSNYYK